jgi:UDP-2,3-diacylglucosamine pyrophosphatase LpxH
MPVDTAADVVVVSDLHLSAGYDERTGTFDRNEDFFYDGAFARLLAHLRERAEREGRRWRLLLLGDVFDFLQVELPGQRDALDTGDSITRAKLTRIARGHPRFFAALGEWVAAGFPLDVVPGNHDIEMIRPSSQRRFVELVAAAGSGAAASDLVRFYPWIYYLPGLLYAEHGHQYDDVNSFRTQLHPFVDAEGDRVDVPLGSYFVAYLFNRIEKIDPFADNVKPATAYLSWALQDHPVRAVATLGYHFALLARVLRDAHEGGAASVEAERRLYRERFLHSYAAEVGLPYEVLVAIDRCAAVPAMTNRRRQLTAVLLRPIVQMLPILGGLVALWQAVGRLGPRLRSFSLLLAGVIGLLWRERRLLAPATRESGALHRTASRIDRMLRRRQLNVPFYVFGHTHEPEQFPLGSGRVPPRYVNSGTWTPTVLAEFDLLATRETFTYVEITRATADHPPRAQLMAWNDNAGRGDLLPLLAD